MIIYCQRYEIFLVHNKYFTRDKYALIYNYVLPV